MTRIPLIIFAVLPLCGCVLTMEYLNPQGTGKSYTLGNPCPYTYRVLENRGNQNPEVRVTINAFQKGEYGITETTLFMVISDKNVMGYQTGQFYSPPMNKEHKISFPEGMVVSVLLDNGETISGRFEGNYSSELTQTTVLLSFPISGGVPDEFTASFPPVVVDGEQFKLGTVRFKREKESWYGIINC